MSDISQLNARFWSEPCGTQLASSLGLSGNQDAESLAEFDASYFSLYPYLKPFFDDLDLSSSNVLEIGLGMGSLSDWLAISSKTYTGLDIASGPVDIVNLRLRRLGLSSNCIQGSILNVPLPDNSFDCIVAIGCLHHTGDLARALAECHRLLRVGGALKLMVYYSYSARRLINNLGGSFSYLLSELAGTRDVMPNISSKSRSHYDINSSGEAAPHTDFISRKSLRYLARSFASCKCELKNFESESIFSFFSRKQWLNTPLPSLAGLDLYSTLIR